jgi:Fe-S cluster assembly protein SufB
LRPVPGRGRAAFGPTTAPRPRSVPGAASILVQVQEGAAHSKSTVKRDALLVDALSRSDTYPYVDIREDDVEMGHEASVSKISEDQLFYLMSRGMTEDEAMAMIVRGFVEPIARELPMEYALELNRLIELQMEGAVG